MNRVVTSRVASLMTAAIVVVIAACSDADGSKPTLTGPSPSASQGGPAGDSANNNPPSNNPGGGHSDTSVTPKPAPKPVASFTLVVHVGFVNRGATDTLTTDAIPGATVSVYEQTLTSNNNAGADTVNINQTLVATGVTDASGNFSAANLKGAAVYAIKAVPPAGSIFGPNTTYLNQAFADVVKLPLTLFPK